MLHVTGIIVQSVMPGFVSTKMSGIRKSSAFVPSPEEYVDSAIATIGVDDATFGYWAHWLMMLIYFRLLRWAISDYRFFKRLRNKMTQHRDIALKRMAEKKSQ